MAAMRFEQVQRFILAKKTFWGYEHFKSNWKQCLCKILERQTKGIMVFLILANYGGACLQ